MDQTSLAVMKSCIYSKEVFQRKKRIGRSRAHNDFSHGVRGDALRMSEHNLDDTEVRDQELSTVSLDKDTFHGGDPMFRNFILMSVFFTLNMGCVTTLTAVAANALGSDLGSNNQAALYGTLMFSSLFLAAYSVDAFGPKMCLVCSNVAVFVSYLGVIIATNTSDPTTKSLTCIGGAAIAGLGLGLGWAGQGVYFGRAAIKYARGNRLKLSGVSTEFGSYFAAIFLGLEVALKVGSTLIRLFSGSGLFFIVYAILAGSSALAMLTVEDMKDGGMLAAATADEKYLLAIMYNQAGKVGGLIMANRKLQLMAIAQFAFGIYTVFLNFTINSRVLVLHFDPAYIGLFSALGAIPWVSLFRSNLNSFFGESSKSFVMILMTFAMVTISAPFVVLGPEDFSKGGVIFLYFAAGVARSSYEFANRSIFVDFFPNDKEAAMPSIFLLSSVATVICFAAFQIESFTITLQALLLLSMSGGALAAYRLAHQIYLGDLAAAAASESNSAGGYVQM
jgi:hypothetical protein